GIVSLPTALAALRAQVCCNPCGHGSRTGLGLVGNDEPLLPRNLFGERYLRLTWRFGAGLSRRITAGFLGRVPVEECTADGSRFRVSGWRLDALLPGDAVGKALHRQRRWTTSSVAVHCRAEHLRSFARSAFLELADDALSDIAHRVDRADHLLLAD